MEPRLKSSKKWTVIPKDYTNQVVEALKETFPDRDKAGEWIVEGRIYPEELLLRVGFLEKGRLKQINIEISIQYKPGKEDVPDLLNFGVDVGASFLDEAFKAESDTDFPRIWEEFTIEKRSVFIQYTVTNTRLEQEADRLLGLHQESLVRRDDLESEADELLEEIKQKLGIDMDDDDIFNGKKKPH